MARQGPQLSAGLRVKLVGGYLVWNLQPGRAAFLIRILGAVCPARRKTAFPAHAPRFTVTGLPWPLAAGLVPTFPGTASVATRPHRRRTPTRRRTPVVTVTAPPRAAGTLTA